MATTLVRPNAEPASSATCPPVKPVKKEAPLAHKVLLAFACLGFAATSLLLFKALAEPSLPYKVSQAPGGQLDSPAFLRTLEVLTNSQVRSHTSVELLPNGENYYPAELAALRQARQSINWEAYIF